MFCSFSVDLTNNIEIRTVLWFHDPFTMDLFFYRMKSMVFFFMSEQRMVFKEINRIHDIKIHKWDKKLLSNEENIKFKLFIGVKSITKVIYPLCGQLFKLCIFSIFIIFQILLAWVFTEETFYWNAHLVQ